MNVDTNGQSKKEELVRRVLLIGDTTLDPLGRLLARSAEPPILQCTSAPYGQVYQLLLDSGNSVWAEKPNYLVVWTAPHLTLPSIAKLLRHEAVSQDQVLREAEQFAAAVLQASDRVGLVIVPTWVLPTYERGIQSLAWRPESGIANWVARANLLLAEKFAAKPNIVLLDAGYWQASLGRPAYDPRMYAVAKILYSQQLFEKAAAEIKAVVRGALGLGKKVVVCDLDNTLWGGVVGDDGPGNLKLGAPDPVGECFSAFQTAIKGLRSRGIVLAICSKNDEKFALSVIDEHPAMVLRKNDFAAWRVNWRDKAENILALAEELNLGLDSFVFLDDSPQEREQVRQILPQVYTPELPVSPSELAPFLMSLTCFETLGIAREDLERTEMYQAERSRKQSRESGGDVEKWLNSLEIRVRAVRLRQENLARAAQLLNKTNQFNLGLRRMDEASLWKWASEPENAVYVFHVSDRFGDSGLTGLAGFSLAGSVATITDFVMSCRVMGKKVEEALLGFVVSKMCTAGSAQVLAPLFDGPRNGPAKEFFSAKYANGGAALALERAVVPSHIEVKEDN
jgi:FkbH-like protein